MKRDEIEQIKETAKEYAAAALAARRDYLALRLKQDPEIRKIIVRVAGTISKTLRQGGSSPASDRLLSEVNRQLEALAGSLETELTGALEKHIAQAVEIGSSYSRAVTVELMTGKVKVPGVTKSGLNDMFVRVNEDAIRAMWERTSYGMKLSGRIWQRSTEIRDTIKTIVQDAVASGQDAVTTARQLEKYVNPEANVPVKYYKSLMERTSGIPENLSYQALRLARTEATAAYGQGSIRAAQASPSALGIRFCLSPAHRVRDICDELASHDSGLGPGVYPLDDPPPYPAHPNTLSFLVEEHASSDAFVSDLLAWIDDPASRPKLQDWYETDYSTK